jgi:sensor c-di-GMP phosphodiesterase-like protein
MARSLRSKRRQKNLRVKRKKFGDREVLKSWEHYHKTRAQKTEQENTEKGKASWLYNVHYVITFKDVIQQCLSTEREEEATMETSSNQISKKDVKKWALSRNQLKKKRKMAKEKAKSRFNRQSTKKRH